MSVYARIGEDALTPPGEGAPLSFAQEQLWFLEQLTPGTTTYHMAVAFRLSGQLRIDVLEDCLTRVVARHEVLRMTFHSADGTPFQVVAPPSRVKLSVSDLGGSAGQQRERLIQDRLRELTSIPFDLEHGPLYRYHALKLADDDYVFVQVLHHIVTDGWSSGVINSELSLAYQALLDHRAPDFGEPGPSYTDYAASQRAQLTGEALDEELAWWTQRLADLPTLEFPADRPRQEVAGSGGAIIRPYPAELLTGMRSLAKEHGVSLYTVLLAALNVVLSRYTSQDDVPVGVTMFNRVDEGIERTVGLFMNMVVLRTDMSGDPIFSELLERILEANLDLYEHQEIPFNLIVNKIQPLRMTGVNPLFQIAAQVISAENFGARLTLSDLTCTPILMTGTESRFDLMINFLEESDQLTTVVEYSRDLFDEWRINGLLQHLENVFIAALDQPSLPISQLPMMSRAEQDELLALGKGESIEYPAEPLHVGVARMARAQPDAVAVVCRGVELSYGELDRRADKLARYLRSLGVEHGQLVAVVLDREMDAFAAMLGVLKAGGAFAMMDPKVPTARLDFMIRNTAARIVLTRSPFVAALPEPSGWVAVLLDADWPKIEAAADQRPLPEWTTGESPAYALHTSGSTGTPKGVLITHRGVALFCAAFRRSFDFSPADRLLQLPALNFDVSQGEIWTAFLVGATLVAVSPDDVQSAEALSTLMRQQRVSYASLSLSMQSLLDAEPYPALKYIVSVGEAADPALVNKWNLPGRTFLNLYGPMEGAIAQTEYKADHIEWKAPPPIGRPHPNRQVYVTDRWNNLVPQGVNGELLIGGDEGGLARGYLNLPQLTAEKFITDPFRPDSKVYRTGDLVRWNAAGQIEFLGRIDNQVKLRGLRIELGEVEIVLQSHPGIRRAVVLMLADRHGENRLVAYFTSVSEPPSLTELRTYLGDTLPDYMVPGAWVALAEFPMTDNGWKVNRKALPAPAEDTGDDADLTEPTTATEEEVARCFAEVLAITRIDTRDSFFDRGGNSLLALRIVSRLSKAFGIKLRVRLLYGNQSVAALSAAIDEMIGATAGD